MDIVRLDQVRVAFLKEAVFENLSWSILDDRVVGLIGANGCGKSTLLKLICGDLVPDEGYIQRHGDLKIGYLPQEPVLNEDKSVWDEVFSAHEALFEAEEKLSAIELRLALPEVYEDEKKLANALRVQEALLEEISALGGNNFEGRVRTILSELGFSEIEMHLKNAFLSGGQKKLVGLAKILITQPNLLLLDEPDNHLDLRGKAILENFINNFKGGVILVSHDRYLLDIVVHEIAELSQGSIQLFKGNYSEYVAEKEMRLARQQKVFDTQQKEKSRLEASAKRLLIWGREHDNEKFIKRGKNILKRIEHMDLVDKPILEPERMGLQLKGWRGSNKVLQLKDVAKTFEGDGTLDDKTLLTDANLTIWHGDRIGLVGENGVGKSVLFRMILDDEPSSGGEIVLGPSVAVGFYAQEHETLTPEMTLIETIRDAVPYSEEKAVAFLKNFLFTYAQCQSKVGTLSGGERSRLQMALVMLSGANFLLLDEPTNNLDIFAAEVLEDALEAFEGTLLVISHDRYFLDRIAQKIVAFEDLALVEYVGNYSDYVNALDF